MRLLILAFTLFSAAAPAKLNVLLITADDLGLQLSSYGETLIRTPELDALASDSVQFDVAYVAQASCSPSRSAMFTGLYPHSNGQYGLMPGTGYSLHPHLRDKTIPSLLKQAGYRTGIIGKLHVAPDESFPFDFRPKVNMRKVRDAAAEAKRFLAGTGDQPFFLMVNYTDPHAYRENRQSTEWTFPRQIDGLPVNPIDPGPKTIFGFQQIDTPEQRVRTANYYNTVMRLDAGVGMLLDELDASGKTDQTLVIFLGDHGPPFARGKTSVYESGLRVPFLVRWPGVSTPMRSPAMVSAVDILPTILDATEQPSPGLLQGRSLRPVLTKKDAPWRRFLVGEFHYHGATPFYPRRAIRDSRWKLILNVRAGDTKPNPVIDGDPAYRLSQQAQFDGSAAHAAFATFADPPRYELYDLESDPNEFRNLSDEPSLAGVRQRMIEALEQWQFATADPFADRAFVEEMARKGAPSTW